MAGANTQTGTDVEMPAASSGCAPAASSGTERASDTAGSTAEVDAAARDAAARARHHIYVVEICAGAAAMSRRLIDALERAGLPHTLVGLCELNAFDQFMYGAAHSDVETASDALTFDFTEWARPDGFMVLIACTPCTPVAGAGQQRGLADPGIAATVDAAPRAAGQLSADIVLMEQ